MPLETFGKGAWMRITTPGRYSNNWANKTRSLLAATGQRPQVYVETVVHSSLISVLRALSWFMFDPLPTRAVQSASWCVIALQGRSIEWFGPARGTHPNWLTSSNYKLNIWTSSVFLSQLSKWETWIIVLLRIVLSLNLLSHHLFWIYFIFNKTVMFLNLVLPLMSILLIRGKINCPETLSS